MQKIKAIALLGALMISGVASADLNTGLVAQWSFDDCTAIDDSGNEHNGAIQGAPQCVDGVQGKALSFNGQNDFVEVQDSNGDFSPPDLTVSVWINPNEAQLDNAGIIDKSHSLNGDIGGWVLQKRGMGSGLQFYFEYCSSSACANNQDQTFTTPINKWSHLVITKQGNIVSNYMNGRLLSKKTYSLSDYPKTTKPLLIGAVKSWNRYFNGSIDEPRIYSRALTTAEIQALYYQINPPIIKGTAPWITSHIVTCQNITQNTTVTIPKTKASAWDCENAGLSVNSGDKVMITIEGKKY